jgi:hypothetical protein
MTRLLPLLVLLTACGAGAPDTAPPAARDLADDSLSRAERLEHLLGALADDSMMGRRIGSAENAKAARFLAAELERYGVTPAGDDGFLQAVPLARVARNGRARFAIPSADLDFDTLPPDALYEGESNVVGVIRGSDPTLAGEAVVIGAHFDHVGVGPAVGGDSIYNGADDDGSGTVAVLEIARELAHGPAPARTVVVLLSTGEEAGLLGTRWYMEHPAFPLDSTVADFQVEMIGRPDSLAGGAGRAWLTGYERTTMGDQLANAGTPIVPDPRPDQRFFFRSDNIPFALAGIPAHTLSSYDLHADYHQPGDEVDRIDFRHMAAVVDAAVTAVRFLADGPRPAWKPGGRDDFPQARR